MTTTVTTSGPDVVPAHAWKVLAVSAAGVFVVFLDATVVNIAFPALSADFPDVSRAGLSWVLNAYAVVFGALLVTSGRLADARGRKRVFQAGLVVFALASALCGLAPTVPALVAARALQAVGAALLVPASLALLLPEFPVTKRATAVGLWGAVGAVAAATGPTLGALLVDGPGWRWVFLVNLPFCAVAVVAGQRVLRESTGSVPDGARPDVLGVALVTAVFGLLSLGIVQGPSWGWGSLRVVGAFVAAAVVAPLLVVRALRHPSPVLPVRLFERASFSLATAGTLLFGAAFFATILCNVLFLTGVWHYSVLRTAVAVLPSPLLAAVTAPFAGRLADRYGFRVVIVPGALSMVAGLLVLATLTGAHPAYVTHFLPGSVLIGLAIGSAFSTLGAASAQALPPQQFAAGSAVNATARQLGAVLGVAVLVAVLGEPGPADALAAFHRSWSVVAVAAAGCAVVCLGLTRPPATPAAGGRDPR
ncbi:MAG: drug resistance transporter, EmrB/QacA subfamily [Frankiales bacterium]|nr:drug resistance transporter, EmrB/QacA subfamily [Frankiales bacterium]